MVGRTLTDGAEDRKRRIGGTALFCGYVGTVVAANWAVGYFGSVPVGLGYRAPAGVYFAGLAFTLRDLTQEALGKMPALIAVVIGSALSAFVAPRVAVASAVAFFVSEILDFASYTLVRRRGLLRAVVLSNCIGILVDSWLFLWLAFGSTSLFVGQVLGKSWMTAATVLGMYALRHKIRTRFSRSYDA